METESQAPWSRQEPAPYVGHSPYTDPGASREWLADAPSDLAGLRRLATQIVFHYRASGDPVALGFAPERMDEIDLRYAERILARARELQGGPIGGQRDALSRVLGCCRDFTLVLVSLAREAGMPARMRVGFAGYLLGETRSDDGAYEPWWLDHVVAEVWDGGAGRWRLVEAQIDDGFLDAGTGLPLDLLDIGADRFLVGADAWLAARAGTIDHARCVVDPSVEVPFLRSWAQLAHNLAVDLAAVNGHELLLWDSWGPLESVTQPTSSSADLTIEHFTMLDALAQTMVDAATPVTTPDESIDRLAEVYLASEFVVPSSVLTLSPLGKPSRRTRLPG
jgi:hypothetical protein